LPQPISSDGMSGRIRLLTSFPAVTDALAETGYQGFLTFEYFHPYAHYPEALTWQTSDSMDRILGRQS
jgi:hexulose-6-phosphate isomerase